MYHRYNKSNTKADNLKYRVLQDTIITIFYIAENIFQKDNETIEKPNQQ